MEQSFHRSILLADHVVAKSSNGNGVVTTVSDDAFKANIVVVFVAVVCGLLCALALNFIIRCLSRYNRTMSAVDDGGEQSHAMKHVLAEKLKMGKFGAVSILSSKTNPSAECPICLGAFADGEKVRVLPTCGHGFHVKCVDTWLLRHPSCPLCRRPLLEEKPVKTYCADSTDVEQGVVNTRAV